MKEDLRHLISKYQLLLTRGESYIKELDQSSPKAVVCQKAINAIWKLIIKDLIELADKHANEPKKKRD